MHSIATASSKASYTRQIDFDELFSSFDDLLLALEKDGRIIQVGSSILRVLGYGVEELIGANITDLFPIEQKALAEREAFSAGMRSITLLSRNGFEVSWRVKSALLKLGEGVVLCLIREEKESISAEDGHLQGSSPAEMELSKKTAEMEMAIRVLENEIAEQKRAEIALRHSEELYRTLAEASCDFIYIVNQNGRYEYVNRSAAQFLGALPSEITGRQRAEFIPQDAYDRTHLQFQEVFSRGQQASLESRMEFSSRDVWLDTRLIPIRDEKGTVRSVLCLSRDITDRKRSEEDLRSLNEELERRVEERTSELKSANKVLQEKIAERKEAEQELKVSEARYRAIVEDQADLICRYLPDGTLTFVNGAYCRYFDRASDELLGQKFPPLSQEEDLEHSSSSNVPSNTSEAGKGVCERQFIAPNGQMCIQWEERAIIDDQGCLIEFQSVGRDVTERKRAEVDSRRQDRLLAAVASAASVLLVEKDISSAMEQAIEVLGLTLGADRVYICKNCSTEGEGRNSYRPWLQWASEANRHKTCSFEGQEMEISYDLLPGLYEALASGEPVKGNLSDLTEPARKALKPFGIRSFLAMPITIDGRFWGFLKFIDSRRERTCSSSDISILKVAAAALGGAISRRRMEIDLKEARDSAESATRAKSEFLANMSHEIRTPMNAVIGMTSFLLGEDLNQEQRNCLETIRNSGDALLAVINDILDFSKAEEGKMVLENQQFDLQKCIEGSMELVSSKAEGKGLKLDYALEEGVPSRVIGDPTRLRQVLLNLLSNAVKFTDKGEINLSVSCNSQGTDKCDLLFAVKDTGIGIPQDRLGCLFRSFGQVDASISRRYGGTGLGLAISRRLIELMGGKIWVESSQGAGSTFYFTISAGRVSSETSILEPSHQVTLPSRELDRSLRILLAEDNPVNQKVTLLMLRRLGYRADVAANGLEALQALDRQSYDLILMDIQMPEMDGLGACRAIRERFPASKQPRIIALTAYALEGDRQRFLDAGMDDYIAKPVQMNDLIFALSRCRHSQS